MRHGLQHFTCINLFNPYKNPFSLPYWACHTALDEATLKLWLYHLLVLQPIGPQFPYLKWEQKLYVTHRDVGRINRRGYSTVLAYGKCATTGHCYSACGRFSKDSTNIYLPSYVCIPYAPLTMWLTLRTESYVPTSAKWVGACDAPTNRTWQNGCDVISKVEP